ncbi:MAG: hypothetical protein WBB01_19855 [Phormidesmis sp.]
MIIVLSKSAQSAVATAEHLRGAIARGPFVFYRSNDYRAVKLAVRLARRKALLINTVLLVSGLVGIFSGATVLMVSQGSILAIQASQVFYLGVMCGFGLIGLESIS